MSIVLVCFAAFLVVQVTGNVENEQIWQSVQATASGSAFLGFNFGQLKESTLAKLISLSRVDRSTVTVHGSNFVLITLPDAEAAKDLFVYFVFGIPPDSQAIAYPQNFRPGLIYRLPTLELILVAHSG